MTEQQQNLIILLFKQGKTYREISEVLHMSAHSVASFLRRKHKNLQTLRMLSRQKEANRFIYLFKNQFNIPEYQAQAIYETIRNRFEVKGQNVRTSGREFTAHLSDLSVPLVCPVLGIPLDYFAESNKAENYPTFDRIDNNLGYVPGNVHIISWRANRIKNDGTAAEHRRIADYLDTLYETRSVEGGLHDVSPIGCSIQE